MKTKGFLLFALVAWALGPLLGCSQESPTPSSTPTAATSASPSPTTTASTGRAVFAIADEAVDIGSVSKILVTIDGIRVHAQGGSWIDLTGTAQTFDLLQLRAQGVAQLLSDAQLPTGIYDGMELGVSQIIVVDAEGEHEAKLPSNKFQLKGELKVEAGATATAHFDFLADQSLHRTGDGLYIFAPVIHLETKGRATAEVRANREVRISGGATDTDARLGMDAEGSIDVGIRVAPDAVLRIEKDGKVGQTNGQALTTGTLKAVDAANGTVTITTRAKTELTLYLVSDTEIKLAAQTSTSASLATRIGAEVVVRYNAETKTLSKIVVAANDKDKADISADLRLTGEVKSVDIAKGVMTITTDSGASVTLKLSSEARINLQGAITTTAGLQGKAGERIKLDYDANSGQLKKLESKTNVELETSASGVLKAVNVADGTVTVTTATGTDVTLKIASESRIIANGSLSILASLRAFIGAQTTIDYRHDTRAIHELHVHGQAKGSTGVTGTIKAVNAEKSTITITTPEGGEVVLSINAASSLLTNGTISSFSDLKGKIGEELHADYEGNTQRVINLKARGETNAKATGTLKDVDAQAGTFTITAEGGDITLKVDATTELESGDRGIRLEDLTRLLGAQVIAEFNAQTMMATEAKIQGREASTGKATGRIKAVDAAASTIIIIADDDGDLKLTVKTDTLILLSGLAGTLNDLNGKIGARVTAAYSVGASVAISIVVIGSATPSDSFPRRNSVAGTLKTVNVLGGTITVAQQTGTELVLKVVGDTKILVQGRQATLTMLVALVGTHVAVQYDVQSSSVLSLESSGRVTDNVTVAGTIRAVDAVSSTLTVAAASGPDVVLKISDQTRLLLGGVTTTLADLKAQTGARVKAEYSAQTNAAVAVLVEAQSKAEAEITGVLKAVNLLGGSLTVASGNAVEFSFTVNSQTKIKINGADGAFAGLAAVTGGRIKVEYDTQTRVATEIEVEVRIPVTATAQSGSGSGNRPGSGSGGGSGSGTGSGSGGSSSTTTTATVTGTLKAVNPVSGTLTIAAPNSGDLTLSAGAGILAQIGAKIGSQVTAQYNVSTRTVVTIS